MAGEAEICNMALGHIGQTSFISNLETERSKEAHICRMYLPILRDATLREFPWTFATRYAALALVAGASTSDWAYVYRYPVDCLQVRKFTIGTVPATAPMSAVNTLGSRLHWTYEYPLDVDLRYPFRIGGDDAGSLIYTNIPDAEIEYTTRIENLTTVPAEFSLALSLRLASYLASHFGADAVKLGAIASERYREELARIKTVQANESEQQIYGESELIRARGD